MNRMTPLAGEELWEFANDGYLRLGKVLEGSDIEDLRNAIARQSTRGAVSNLLDPAAWPEGENGDPPTSDQHVAFAHNLWRNDDVYRRVAFDHRLAGWAAQALGATAVRLLEDNALTKEPGSGGELRWHQDYSYWPLGQPHAVTIWIALDDVTIDNGAVRMARGSHLLGERLPAVFGTGAAYYADRRPSTVKPISDPESSGLSVETMVMRAGEATIHHALTWHASGPNTSDSIRRAAVFRYVADGTTWFGARRYEFNYTDEVVGLELGDPIGGPYFPLVPPQESS